MKKVNVKFLVVPVLGFIVGLSMSQGAPAQKKKAVPSSKTTTSKSATTAKKGTTAKGKAPAATANAKTKTYSRSRGRSPQPVAARRRYGQQSPTEDRHSEIQKALAARGYLSAEPTGKWDPSTIEAMKRFQQDQNLPPNGKITSLSLIALGLGPKRNPAATASMAPPAGTPTP